MRTLHLAIAAVVAAGCARNQPSHVHGGVLGRVVVYRNGVAFYERTAVVTDGRLTVRVPRDRVDDFLKSLTVVDPSTRKPLSVAIPRKEATDGSYLTMTLETATVRNARVLLTYVTEAPAWKPSYRVVVGDDGKVMLEGWAVVDNTTSEDWNGVLVGVGASSALAFRYDLWSVRRVDRDLLQDDERLAIAPPTGMSPYADGSGEELVRLDAQEVRVPDGAALGISFSGSTSLEDQYAVDGSNTTGVTGSATSRIGGEVRDQHSGEPLAGVTIVATAAGGGQPRTVISDGQGRYALDVAPGTYAVTYYYGDTTAKRTGVRASRGKTTAIALRLAQTGGETIAISDRPPTVDPASTRQGTTITRDYTRAVPGRTFDSALGTAAGSASGSQGDGTAPPPPIAQGDAKLAAIVDKVIASRRDVLIEVHAAPGGEAAATARGTAVKHKLVDDGIPASRIHVVPRIAPGSADHVRVLAVARRPRPETDPLPADLGGDAPVGESHFMADRPMTVRAGSSAMVAVVHGETTGGVVYLYDPISERGHDRFAFKAVRLDNPTTNTLEPGPVTVYGNGRFIGEGITEPVPPSASVVVPFALDKQVIVTRDHTDADRIAKLVTVQRGVLTAEVQHRRSTRFTVTSRSTTPATVYLRHRLESGWTLVEHPPSFMQVGDSHLFELELGPGETRDVTIAEATPVTRTLELDSTEALGMMRVFVDEPQASPQLKRQIDTMIATHRKAADLVDKIATMRDQLVEYRGRAGELHAQIVTLKAVRTSGSLMTSLRGRLAEISDRTQRATLALVDTQEQLMLTRVAFQNQLADLRLTDEVATTAR